MNFFIFLVKLIICSYLITFNELVSGSITIFNNQNQTLEIVDSVSAAFGPTISEFGFKGYVIVSNPIGGCTTLEKPPNVSFVDPDQWIVLIKRTPTVFGNCSFDLKVHNAQIAGYKAVIIYNSESDNLIKMSSSGKYDIQIPSVFISLSDGLDIASFYTYKNRTYVVINNDDDNLNYLLIPFICVVAVCFIIAISIFVSKFVIHIYKLRKNRFPKSALKKIPTKKYQKTDKYDTCPICLNEYEEGEKMRILPCEHAYHVECIDKWLLRNNRFCPVCKRRVLPGGSDSESDDGRGTATTTSHVNHLPNEDENSNESSRLLIRNTSIDDNLSSNTISTIINHTNETSQARNSPLTNNNANTDLSSMNNQMTSSLTSSQLPQPLNKDHASSRYGSISSSLNIITNPTTSKSIERGGHSDSETETSTSKKAASYLLKQSEEHVDSKATPEFYSPVVESCVPKLENNEPVLVSSHNESNSLDLPQNSAGVAKPAKKRSSKKKNKVSHEATEKPGNVNVENELQSEQNDDEIVDGGDKKLLLQQDKHEKNVKKSNKKANSSSQSNKNSNDDENEDQIV